MQCLSSVVIAAKELIHARSFLLMRRRRLLSCGLLLLPDTLKGVSLMGVSARQAIADISLEGVLAQGATAAIFWSGRLGGAP